MNASVKQPLELKKRRLTSLQQQLPNFSAGASGEERAIQFLKQKNFQIIYTNVRFGLHEVDIIAIAPGESTDPIRLLNTRKPGSKTANSQQTLVFCEVKARATSFFGDPSLAVSAKKLKSMQFVAREYLRKHHWGGEYRFDVIAVLPTQIEHFENVTWWR